MVVLHGGLADREIHLEEIACCRRVVSELTFAPLVRLMTPASRQGDRAENVTVNFTTA